MARFGPMTAQQQNPAAPETLPELSSNYPPAWHGNEPEDRHVHLAVEHAREEADSAQVALEIVTQQAVRKYLDSGISQRDIANLLGLSKTEVNRIAKHSSPGMGMSWGFAHAPKAERIAALVRTAWNNAKRGIEPPTKRPHAAPAASHD